MQKTGYVRKMDYTGRIVIPAKLREELGLNVGDIYDIYIHEYDGDRYLCIRCVEKITEARRLLEAAGMNINQD